MYWCAPDALVDADILRTAAENMAVLPPGKRKFEWLDVQPLGLKKRLANYNRSRLDFGFDCVAKASLDDDSLFTDDSIADEKTSSRHLEYVFYLCL